MQKSKKSAEDKQDEGQIRSLVKVIEASGISVRREKLTRGHSFRVKSGECFLSEQHTLFVDKNLPIQQQLSVLIDYIVDHKVKVTEDVSGELSSQTRSLISAS